MSDTILKLQQFSLCSKVTQELENHMAINDKVLAEFIIELAKESSNYEQFAQKLEENEAEFTQQFQQSLYNLIRKMLPKQLLNSKVDYSRGKEVEQEKFGGLANEQIVTEQNREVLAHRYPALAIKNKNKEEIELKLEDEEQGSKEEEDKEKNKEKNQEKNKEKNQEKNKENLQKAMEMKSKEEKKKKSKSRSRSRSHHRHRHHHHHHSKKDPSNNHNNNNNRQRKELELNEIYDGVVTRVKDFGCFVALQHVYPRSEGLVHISNISDKRINNAFNAVKRNDQVKVKVISIIGSKIGLSMKEVDQVTGKLVDKKKLPEDDILQLRKERERFEKQGKREYGELTGIKIDDDDARSSKRNSKKQKAKRLTSPELWELTRLQYHGHATLNQPLVDQDHPPSENEDGGISDEDYPEIEINDREPAFLENQTTKCGINLEPVKLVKNPQGTLQRAALNAKQQAVERKEIKEQQSRNIMEQMPKEMSKYWDDPNADPATRTLMQTLKGISTQNYEIPDWKKDTFKKNYPFATRSLLTIKEQREQLPIYNLKLQLINAIYANNILICIGETGSGKTTQITQYCLEAGLIPKGSKFGCTQPRRVAAMSVAKRVAEEMNVALGEEVGYSIRFEDCTSPQTIIKYMTDGMLLREALIDRNMSQYSVIMLDEAHERTIHTDVLFGIMKEVAHSRPDFKLIVTSATLDAEKFSRYFDNCNIFRIPGITFPVEILYTNEPESDYLEAALMTVLQIHLTEPAGDILLFLTGQEEIDTACEILTERMKKLGDDAPQLIILPVYSALPSDLQSKIFDPAPPGSRKIVIATNIAEASLTIDGIFYVVDPGFAKIKVYNPKLGMDSLVVAPISQASSKQRAGRAGRTGPGKCYRLYTEHACKHEMLPVTVPEIQRTNLSNTVLLLKAMGINDLINFDFMDPPPLQSLITALENLYALGALDDEGLLSRLGRKMAEFPLEPTFSKMLLTAVDLSCVDEVITVIAMLSVQNVFYRPRDKQALADQKKAKFFQPEGDHLTLLTIYEAWKQNNFSNVWCHDNFIQSRSMKRAQDIRKQLLTLIDRYKFSFAQTPQHDYNKIRKAITAGFFFHAARKDPQEGYRTLLDNQQVFIHPASSLYGKSPEFVIYHELVLTTKEYMREVCEIDPKWLVQVAQNYYRLADANVLSKRKRNEKLEPLYNKYDQDPNAWRLSRRKG